METANTTRRTLEERIRSLELENRQYDPRFSKVKKEILKVALLEVDQGDPHASGLEILMMYDLYISFFLQKKRKCFLDNLVLFPMFSSLSLESPWIM